MKNIDAALMALLLAACGFTGVAAAADWQTSASLVMTHQTSDKAGIADESAAKADLILRRRADAGEWLVHFEGATTPGASGVSGRLPEANAISGSALDMSGAGRVQLSELYYQHASDPKRLISVGYLDVSGFFEQSRIASDETTQFLGASFKGNPTIEFPDYTLGAVYEHSMDKGPVWRTGLTSSNGLANNPERSYSQLLSVGKEDKGAFAITSLSWRDPVWLLRVGVWTNTANHQAIDGSGRGHKNYGSYLLSGYRQGRHALNFRLGVANDKVSQASAFTSLGYQFKQDAYVLGAGVARAFLSPQESNKALGDTVHYEVYLRYAVSKGVFLTGDVQHIVNSNFGTLAANRNQGITVYGLRLTLLYE